MSPITRNKFVDAEALRRSEAQGGSQGDGGAGLVPETEAERSLETSGILDPGLRKRLDRLEREYATILTRLDRMSNRQRTVIPDDDAGC